MDFNNRVNNATV